MAPPVADWEYDAAREFLDAVGAGADFLTAIHPADEMHRILRDWGPQTLGPGGYSAYFAYLRSGWEALRVLEHVLTRTGRDPDRCGPVLEFACGFGRVTRWLVDRFGAARITAADVVPEALRFVRRRLGVRTFPSAYEPAAVEAPETYDLIFVGSLFSHLPPHRFGPWLRRLYGWLAPGGLLVFSTHPLERAPADAAACEGYAFVARSETARLPGAEYGLAFVAPARVAALAREAGVRYLYHRPSELWAVQDLYVAARMRLTGLEDWGPAPVVRGAIDEVFRDGADWLDVRGWAADFAAGGAPAAVYVRANEVAAFAEQGFPRPDVNRALRRPDLGPTGWRVRLPVGRRRPLLLVAWGRSEGETLVPFAARSLPAPGG